VHIKFIHTGGYLDGVVLPILPEEQACCGAEEVPFVQYYEIVEQSVQHPSIERSSIKLYAYIVKPTKEEICH